MTKLMRVGIQDFSNLAAVTLRSTWVLREWIYLAREAFRNRITKIERNMKKILIRIDFNFENQSNWFMLCWKLAFSAVLCDQFDTIWSLLNFSDFVCWYLYNVKLRVKRIGRKNYFMYLSQKDESERKKKKDKLLIAMTIKLRNSIHSKEKIISIGHHHIKPHIFSWKVKK